MILRNSLALAIAGPLALAAAALVQFLQLPRQRGPGCGRERGLGLPRLARCEPGRRQQQGHGGCQSLPREVPERQYAQFLTGWLGTAKMAALDAAIKEKRAADMITVGREILQGDPENLNVICMLSRSTRPPLTASSSPGRRSRSSRPAETLSGVQGFNNGTLGRLTQVLAIDAQKTAGPAQAIKLYEQSTALAPQDPLVAGKNLYAVYNIRLASYLESVKAWNAIPDADKAAAGAEAGGESRSGSGRPGVRHARRLRGRVCRFHDGEEPRRRHPGAR